MPILQFEELLAYMAKKSSVLKNNYRRELSNRYRKYRTELREKSVNLKLSDDERMEAQLKLQKLPRDTSSNRVVNRCYLTGRPRGNLKRFGFSRMVFRQLAHAGKIPGVTKASW
jgi:small subunit ribosomal protein S14